MEDRKKRVPNFTNSETRLLISLVKKYKNILGNKTTKVANNQLKAKTWRQLAEDFNSMSGICSRSAETLRSKYENLKKTLKRKHSAHHRKVCRTDEGPPQDILNYTHEKVLLELTGASVDGLQILESTEYNMEEDMGFQTDSDKKADPLGSPNTQHTPHQFLLKKKRAVPHKRPNLEFTNTMEKHSELSKKKQEIIEAQLRRIEEKTKNEKVEHDLRCAQVQNKILQDAKEHRLKCELLTLDIEIKKKILDK